MKTRIKVLRTEQNINQQDLAKTVGVTRQTINALENNRYNPSLILAYKIMKALNCERIEEVFIISEEELV